MDATFARANPQKFIDYLSTSDKVLWHFINDPYWGYNVKTPPNWGWCGSVQANFFGSLTNDFKMLKDMEPHIDGHLETIVLYYPCSHWWCNRSGFKINFNLIRIILIIKW